MNNKIKNIISICVLLWLLGTNVSAKGIAVVIGLNQVDPAKYAGWYGRLTVAENDASAMKQVTEFHGFETQMLLGAAATREAVKNSIISAAAELEAGDVFLLYYSGHGNSIIDLSLDYTDEVDFQDESWCLYNGHLLDDELALLWKRFASGVKIIVISDSCHSGSVVKFLLDLNIKSAAYYRPPNAAKTIPPIVWAATYEQNKSFYDGLASQVNSEASMPHIEGYNGVLLAACEDGELAYEAAVNSVFTKRLLELWNGGNYTGSYREFLQEIKGGVSGQTPTYFPFGTGDPVFDTMRPFKIY